MTTRRQRPGPPGFDRERYQRALDEIERLVKEGDTSDTSWQDSLPEAPDLLKPEQTVAIVIPRTAGGRKPTRRQRSGVARAGHHPRRPR